MAERKIVVPKGMLESALSRRNSHYMGDADRVTEMLEAALGWLSENPIVPTMEQFMGLMRTVPPSVDSYKGWSWMAVEWQRRMFLAPPEPEMIGEETLNGFCSRHQRIGDAVLEAYRRGQKAGKS